MERWIVNASPLILLGKIGRLDLLERLSPVFEIPSAVASEIRRGPQNDAAKIWLDNRAITARIVQTTVPRTDLLAWDLGSGETAVLAHCYGHADCRAVLDDRAARTCAGVYGIRVIGTVGILIRAKRSGYIDLLEPELSRLVKCGSLLSTAIVLEALKLAGERP